MRIDAHQHFWQVARGDYAWLTPELTTLYRDYLPEDYQDFIKRFKLDGTIVVQAADTLAETEYLLKLANEHEWILGVVGWVDMLSPHVVQDLEYLNQHPKFLGIRPMLQDIPDPQWMLKPELDHAYQALIDLDLRFDALVKSPHLPHLLTLLKRYPELKCVIDHGAKPQIHSQQWQAWAKPITQLAHETTAYCKLSGLITEAGQHWTTEQLQPYVNHLIEHFGTERLMFGSDWPVVRLAGEYEQWWQSLSTLIKSLSLDKQENILGLNAARFYGLN